MCKKAFASVPFVPSLAAVNLKISHVKLIMVFASYPALWPPHRSEISWRSILTQALSKARDGPKHLLAESWQIIIPNFVLHSEITMQVEPAGPGAALQPGSCVLGHS